MKESLKYGLWWAVMPVLGCLAITLFFHEELRLFDAVFIVAIYPVLVWVGTLVYKATNSSEDESLSEDILVEQARKRRYVLLLVGFVGLVVLGLIVLELENRKTRHSGNLPLGPGIGRLAAGLAGANEASR